MIVLEGGATIVLDVADGSTLMTGARFGGLQVAALGERFATWAPAGGGHVHDVDGTELFAVQALPAQLSADDGSQPGTIVVDEGPQVAGVDATTGAQQWRTPTEARPAPPGLGPAGGRRCGQLRRAGRHGRLDDVGRRHR